VVENEGKEQMKRAGGCGGERGGGDGEGTGGA